MKKIYLSFTLLLVLVLGQKAAAQYISGPLTLCSGQTATYTVYGPSCMVQIDGPSGLDYGTYNHIPGTSSFTITWNNSTLSTVTDNFKIYISNMVYNPDGSSTGCPAYFEISMSVTVKPNITSVNTPSTPSITYISGKLYEFSTYSSNALNYEWVVTGGTIQGSSSGNTVRIIRSSTNCTLTARVRGYTGGCNGNVYSQYSATKSYTVPTPPFSYINGTSYLYPYSTLSYTPFFSTTSSEQGSVTSWSLSDPAGKLSWYSSGNTAYVSAGAPTSTLHFATITCTVSNGCGSKTMSKSLTYGGQSGLRTSGEGSNDGKVKLYPNPSRSGSDLNLEISAESEIDNFVILNESGTEMEKVVIDDQEGVSRKIKELAPGTYYLRLMRKGELIETRRFLVE